MHIKYKFYNVFSKYQCWRKWNYLLSANTLKLPCFQSEFGDAYEKLGNLITNQRISRPRSKILVDRTLWISITVRIRSVTNWITIRSSGNFCKVHWSVDRKSTKPNLHPTTKTVANFCYKTAKLRDKTYQFVLALHHQSPRIQFCSSPTRKSLPEAASSKLELGCEFRK